MPIRRRVDRRKVGEARAWAEYLLWGRDYFDELETVGLTEETAAPIAEETWHRLGREVIAYLDDMHVGFSPYDRPIWAERQFGAPRFRRQAGGRRT